MGSPDGAKTMLSYVLLQTGSPYWGKSVLKKIMKEVNYLFPMVCSARELELLPPWPLV